MVDEAAASPQPENGVGESRIERMSLGGYFAAVGVPSWPASHRTARLARNLRAEPEVARGCGFAAAGEWSRRIERSSRAPHARKAREPRDSSRGSRDFVRIAKASSRSCERSNHVTDCQPSA